MLTLNSVEKLKMKVLMEAQLNEEDEKIKGLQKNLDDLSGLNKTAVKEFRRKEESLPREFEEITTQRELEAERERANEIIVSKNGSGNTPLHYRIRKLLASRESLDDIEQALINYRRYRQPLDAFRSGAYESWIG